jgi:hypothetical protein
LAAAIKLRGEYARLNFPRVQGDQGALSGGAQSAMGDAGVPPALTSRVLTSTLDAKLQEIAYQKALQAQIAGGDQGVLTDGAQSAMGDAGVPPALTSRVLTSTLDAKLQEIAYQKALQAQIAGGDQGVLTDGALVDDAGSEAYQIDMSWDALQLDECHPGTNDVYSTTSSTSVLQGRPRQQLQLEHESGGYGSPRSPGLCVTSSNTDTNIADGSVKRLSTTPTSAMLSLPGKFNVWRHCE